MIICIIYLIFSFILENFMSNIFTSTFSNISFFTTVYTIIALAVIYPYFYNDKKYFILVLIFGLLFDITYTSTFLINIIIFFVIAIVIKILNNVLSENVIMTNIISIISVTVYHILSFIILNMVGYGKYSFILLGRVIIHSIIMTVIFTSSSYFVLNFIYNKINIRQIK